MTHYCFSPIFVILFVHMLICQSVAVVIKSVKTDITANGYLPPSNTVFVRLRPGVSLGPGKSEGPGVTGETQVPGGPVVLVCHTIDSLHVTILPSAIKDD